MSYMPDIIDHKTCPQCERTLVKYINFSPKGRLCRDCARQRGISDRKKMFSDPKLRWNRIVMGQKRANLD